MLALMKLEEDREEAKVSKTTLHPRRRRKQKVRSNSPSCESQDDDRDDEGSNSMSSSDDRGDSSDDQDDVSDESDTETKTTGRQEFVSALGPSFTQASFVGPENRRKEKLTRYRRRWS